MKNKILIWLIVVILLVSNMQAVTEEKNKPLEIKFGGISGNQEREIFEGDNFKAILDESSKIDVKTNEDGSKTIKLTGSGTITIKGQSSLNNIKNAEIKIGRNNEIEFATFTALNNQLYKFKYNKEEIEITANKDSIVTFDPKNKEKQISGDNLKEIKYGNSKIKPSLGLTEINFDEETKEIKELKLPGKSQYINEERKLFFSGENEFSVYFDGRNIKDSKKDAISISDNLISAKGRVKIDNKEFKISYQGNDNNVYTEYNFEFQSFDIKFGDAEISNGISTIEIKNGRELLNLQKGEAEPFSYRYSIYRGKEEKIYYTRINQGDLLYGNLEVVSFNEGKKNIVGVYSIGEVLSKGIGNIIADLKRSSEEDEEAKNTEIAPYLTPENVLQLEAIEKEIERLKQINEEVPEDILRTRDALELKDLQGEIGRLVENKRINEAWAKINDYLKKERSPEAIALANLGLYSVFKSVENEYKNNLEYFEKKPDSKALYENSRSMYEKYNNLADRSFGRVVDVYQDLKKDKDKKEEVTLKLGSLFLQKGDFSNANDEFSELIDSSKNKEAISSAYLGKSMIRLNQNLPESALLNLRLAVENDPSNENAKEVYKNLRISLLNSIRDGRYDVFKEQYKVFNEKWNIKETRFGNSGANTLNLIAAEFGVMNLDIEKLNLKEQNTGAAAFGAQVLSRLIARDVNLEELSKANYLERKEIIGKALDMSYLSQKEIENLFLSKTPEERRKLIKDSLGYEPDLNKVQDNAVTSWLKHLEIRRNLITKEKGKIYADVDETLGNIAFSTLAAERDWDTALLIASGDVEKAKEIMKQRGVNEKEINEKSRYMEFDFKTGRDYDEKSNIQKTWINSVNGAVNLKNAAWFLVPGALARPVKGILGYVPGAAKVIEGTAALKNELTFSRALASQWSIDNMPTMRRALSFGTEESLEWISGYFTGSQLAELSVAYLPIIRTAKPPRLTDIFDLKGEKILGYTFENKNALNEFLNKNNIKQLTGDVFEINGKKLIVLVKGKETKTKGLKSLLNVDDIKVQQALTKIQDLSIEVTPAIKTGVGGMTPENIQKELFVKEISSRLQDNDNQFSPKTLDNIYKKIEEKLKILERIPEEDRTMLEKSLRSGEIEYYEIQEKLRKKREWNNKNLGLEQIALVHLTHYLPEGRTIKTSLSARGILESEGKKTQNPRSTIHFAMNGAVGDHGIQTRTDGKLLNCWSDCEYAIIVPAEKVEKRILDLMETDTWIMGDLDLPDGSSLVISGDFSPDQIKGIKEKTGMNPVYNKGLSIREAVATELENRGYTSKKVGEHAFEPSGGRWAHFEDLEAREAVGQLGKKLEVPITTLHAYSPWGNEMGFEGNIKRAVFLADNLPDKDYADYAKRNLDEIEKIVKKRNIPEEIEQLKKMRELIEPQVLPKSTTPLDVEVRSRDYSEVGDVTLEQAKKSFKDLRKAIRETAMNSATLRLSKQLKSQVGGTTSGQTQATTKQTQTAIEKSFEKEQKIEATKDLLDNLNKFKIPKQGKGVGITNEGTILLKEEKITTGKGDIVVKTGYIPGSKIDTGTMIAQFKGGNKVSWSEQDHLRFLEEHGIGASVKRSVEEGSPILVHEFDEKDIKKAHADVITQAGLIKDASKKHKIITKIKDKNGYEHNLEWEVRPADIGGLRVYIGHALSGYNQNAPR